MSILSLVFGLSGLASLHSFATAWLMTNSQMRQINGAHWLGFLFAVIGLYSLSLAQYLITSPGYNFSAILSSFLIYLYSLTFPFYFHQQFNTRQSNYPVYFLSLAPIFFGIVLLSLNYSFYHTLYNCTFLAFTINSIYGIRLLNKHLQVNAESWLKSWMIKLILPSVFLMASQVFMIFNELYFWKVLALIWLSMVQIWHFYEILAFRHNFQVEDERNMRLHSPDHGSHPLEKRLELILETEKPYKDPSFDLNKLSFRLDLSSQILSERIPAQFGKSFPELINSYRVEEVKKGLGNKNLLIHEIEELAYEAGFRDAEVFYQAFEKATSYNPYEYQERLKRRN